MPPREKSRGKPFPPGRSGNPLGRPKGIRAKSLQRMDEIFAEGSEAVALKTRAMAEAGDVGAIRLYLDRMMPPIKDRPIHFDLPPIDTPADLPKATAALLAGVAAGEITPSEAADLGRSIDVHLKAIATGIFDARLAALEATPTASDEGDDGGEA